MPNPNNKTHNRLSQYYVHATVDWDVSKTESIPQKLPKYVYVPVSSPFTPETWLMNEITEYLSNEYGMCVNSVTIETV